MFDKLKDSSTPLVNFGIAWTINDVGFGQFWFRYDEELDKVICSNEMMSKETIKKVLCTMVDDCVLEDQ